MIRSTLLAWRPPPVAGPSFHRQLQPCRVRSQARDL